MSDDDSVLSRQLNCARARASFAPAPSAASFAIAMSRRIGQADITVRFPRAWLERWRPVAEGIDRTIGQLRPSGN